MFLTVLELKCLSSAAMNFLKEPLEFLTLPEGAPPRLSDARPTERVFLHLWKAENSGGAGIPNDVRFNPQNRTLIGCCRVSALCQ